MPVCWIKKARDGYLADREKAMRGSPEHTSPADPDGSVTPKFTEVVEGTGKDSGLVSELQGQL